MRLIECYIENFGKLSAYTHRFKDGLNATLAENGWGKTTLAAFIKAMLYGLNVERKASLDENERKKYAPWQGGRYGGSLTFEENGRIYRIERSFGSRPADDAYRLVDAASGANSFDFGDNPGLALFDIDAAGFERTIFLSEKNLSGAIANDSISAKLSDLVGTTGDVGGVSTAVKQLEERGKYYKKRGGAGEIGQLKLRISECEAEIERLMRKRDELDEKEKRLVALSAEIRELDAKRREAEVELAAARAESESRGYREQHARMREAFLRDKEEYARLEEFFREGVPTQLEIDEARDAARDARALRDARRDLESPELTELRTFFSRSTDFSEIETVKQLRRAERDTDAERSALSKNLTFAEATLAEELGGSIPSPAELDSCISAFGSKVTTVAAIGCGAAAVLIAIISLFTTPYLLIGAAAVAIASAALAVFGTVRARKARDYAASIGVHANLSRLAELKERLISHLSVKERDSERCRQLEAEAKRYSERILGFTSAYPHLQADTDAAILVIEEKYKRYYALLEVARAGESNRAATDMRIEHLERRAAQFTERYKTDAPDPFEEVRSRLNSFLYARRTMARREEELSEFALLHGITDEPTEPRAAADTASIAERSSELERQVIAKRREQALLDSEYNAVLSEVQRIDELTAERDAYRERLCESEEILEIITLTAAMLTDASNAMTARYIGGTKARFEHYLELIGDAGEFAMGTDFVLKRVDRGETREAESYSKGTRDLYAFCLRLALSDSLYGGELPFIMLDDPFATLDGARLTRAKALVSSIAKEKQVIYFTCSKERMI